MNILVISDSPTIPTGYGRVSAALLPGLAQAGFHLKVVGRGYQGGDHPFPFEIFPHDPSDALAKDTATRLIQEWNPDMLLTIGDLWMVDFLRTVEKRGSFRWLAYFSLDGGPVPLPWQQIIRDIDLPVVFSRFSRDLVQPHSDRPVAYIPHGVDTHRFVPMDDKQELKEAVGLGNRFVVGCVARNQARKNLPALLRSFAAFAQGKDDVGLYMHTAAREPHGWDLSALVHRFGIEKQTFFTETLYQSGVYVSDPALVRIYNLFDIFVLPTTGEGFGLPILESQSCAVPALVTNYSACPELVTDPSQLLPVKTLVAMNRLGIDQAVVDEEAMAGRLEEFYRDWKEQSANGLKELGIRGRHFAEGFPWSRTVEGFIREIRDSRDEEAANRTPVDPLFLRIGRRRRRPYSITWHGIVHDSTGYSQVSRQSVLALDRIGLTVRTEPVDRGTPETEMHGGERTSLARLTKTPVSPDSILVVHLQPDAYPAAQERFPHRKRIGFTAWETDRIPGEWVEACNGMDAMIVPSRFNREVFARSGVRAPIFVARHGVDPSCFYPSPERFDLGEDLPGFRFMSIGTWQHRKGTDLLLEAFFREFSIRDDVCLILKTSGVPTRHAWEQIHTVRDHLQLHHEPAPVYITAADMTVDQLRALYHTASCFVLPSRGEGAGLPFLEAAAQGIPSIAPRWGGQADFLTRENAFLIDGDLVPVDAEKAAFHWFRAGMYWFQPDLAHLVRLMRWVVTHPDEARRRGERARADVIPDWTWERTVMDLLHAFDSVWGEGL